MAIAHIVEAAPPPVTNAQPARVAVFAGEARAQELATILTHEGLSALGRLYEPELVDAVVSWHPRFDRVELAAVRELRARIRDIPLVLVIGDAKLRSVRQALGCGASAVVSARSARRALVPALRAAVAGLVVLPVEFRQHFGAPTLTAREKQVLAILVMGFGNAEIAAKLHIAETTVKSHLTSIFEKLGVRSRSEAASLVLDPVRGYGLGVLALTGADDG